MDTLLEILKIFGDLVGPILVIYVGAKMEFSRRDAAKLKKLEQESTDKKEKELQEKFDSLMSKIDKISAKVDDLEGQIQTMKDVDQEYQESLDKLSKSHQISNEYVHQMAQLVMVLAEGMRDQHLDGNITKAIASYRDFEQQTLSHFMTRPLDD